VRVGDEEIEAGAVVLAGDWRGTQRLLGGLCEMKAVRAGREQPTLRGDAAKDGPPGPVVSSEFGFERFVAAPITTVHLWYDREVVDVDHAVLLDARIQWMFCKSRIRGWDAGLESKRGAYLELVISASWAEIGMGREEILAAALREVEMFFPAVREARLLKSAVLKEARATFSVVPGLDAARPAQRTAWPGLFVAGDWTATDWPSTMEGAVRSGRLAAGEVAGARGRFMARELEAEGSMRLL
jgi:zeta-carotene desaturase